MVTWNNLAHTRRCLAALEAHTDAPYELIVVDNASGDGTVDWVRTLPRAQGLRRGLVLLTNPENRGFAPAVNQGLAAAGGETVCLLNNDLLLPPGWLSRLHRQLDLLPDAGAVGPLGSGLGAKQDYVVAYGPLPYLDPGNDGAAFTAFARAWAETAAGTFTEAKSLSGACLLMRTALLRAMGGLDPGCRLGADDADLSLRLRLAGYRLYVAEDVFVHHFGHASFARLNPAAEAAVAQEAWDHFNRKWQGLGVDWETLFVNEVRWHYDGRFRNRRGYAPLTRPPRIRLDLGSGTQPAGGAGNPDWIHCDGRLGPCVEVVCDLRALPFPDDHADVVRASHVLEHFAPAEVPAVLQEWGRVLKPGGVLTVITPDLAHTCRAYTAGQVSAGAVTANLLGAGEDAPDLHRSLWDTVSLTVVLQQAGFAAIRRDPAYPAWQLKLDARKPPLPAVP
ncbi:conserved protein of unknown function [Candidatus Hydrogenisulfobacillus filiaventi]|uniref:Uncharacterized protein n=1 Tax=Candidatus Hydrogenisulfobacillus filiaventi TaxID=2707344 RepID=A0A6F8ZEE6_9FIRM|nr:conserved protein of unknown function [Candidatus Hydrogenisulfobacillus filiaventi]